MKEKIKKERRKRTSLLSRFFRPKKTVPDEMPAEFYPILLSNHKTKLFLSSYGHIEYINGRKAIFLSDFDRLSLRDGMNVEVDIDGTLFPTVPLGRKTDGFQSQFSFIPHRTFAEYRSIHQNTAKTYEIRLIISVLPDRQIAEFSCAVTGDYHAFSLILHFRPVLAEKNDHVRTDPLPPVQYRYFPKDDALLFYRPPKNKNKEPRYFGMVSSVTHLLFDHSFPQTFTVRSGWVICRQRLSLYFGEASGEEEILYLLDRCRKQRQRKKRKRCFATLLQLQSVASGLSQPADAFERFLLKKICFGQKIQTDDGEDLQRFGIYGDNPIVSVRFSDTTDVLTRLSFLLRFFKYHCVRGLRYDLILLYRDDSLYPLLTETIRKAGCEHLSSFSCGIFPLNETVLSDRERRLLLSFSADDGSQNFT